MSTNPSSEPDPTTETDQSLLEQAAQAELSPTTLKQAPGASEHPSGQVAATDAEQSGRASAAGRSPPPT
jgi:hypothetical protein